MKQNKPIYKKWWFWVLLLFAAAIVGSIGSGSSNDSSSELSSEATSEASIETESMQEPITTSDQLTAIIDSQKIKYSDLELVPLEKGDGYIVSMNYDESSWDNTHFVSKALSFYINLCKEAFQIEGIDKIELYLSVPMIDSKGNESMEKAFMMSMPKEKFKEYNWDNLAYLDGYFDSIKADCDFLNIHPGISKEVDYSKVMYQN